MEVPTVETIKLNQNLRCDGDAGRRKKKGFFEKAKENKWEIAIGAGLVISVVAVGLVYKNKTALKSAIQSSRIEEVLPNSLEIRNVSVPLISDAASKNVVDNLPVINVKEHIRNLPEGWRPSINKVELAAKNGYLLKRHQTWVNHIQRYLPE